MTGKLQQMNEEARETERRGTELAEELDRKKTAVLDRARETKGEASDMMLIDWALPIQERHFEDVKAGSVKLAGREDPASAA